MKINFIKTTLLASLIAIPALTLAQPSTQAPIKLTSVLSLKQITHPLYQPDSKIAPKPFYKKQCDNAKAQPYQNASGSATLLFNPQTDVVDYTIHYNGLSGSPIMAHFHLGAAGKGGPIVQTICGMPPKNSKALGFSAPALSGASCPAGTSGTLTGSYKLAGNPDLTPALSLDQERKDLLAGKLYINIHTCLNEVGELRGQVMPASS